MTRIAACGLDGVEIDPDPQIHWLRKKLIGMVADRRCYERPPSLYDKRTSFVDFMNTSREKSERLHPHVVFAVTTANFGFAPGVFPYV